LARHPSADGEYKMASVQQERLGDYVYLIAPAVSMRGD
jgi:hypothetical protein